MVGMVRLRINNCSWPSCFRLARYDVPGTRPRDATRCSNHVAAGMVNLFGPKIIEARKREKRMRAAEREHRKRNRKTMDAAATAAAAAIAAAAAATTEGV